MEFSPVLAALTDEKATHSRQNPLLSTQPILPKRLEKIIT
jgi:hypothetical protein